MEDNISDRGFVSGFIGVGIHMTIQHILQHIYIASLCKEELANLRDLAMIIELIVMHIQHNRVAFKTGKDKDTPSAVNKWLNDLHGLLLQASKIVQWCSKPKSRLNFSGCKTKKKISSLNSDITEHLRLSPLLVRIPELQAGDTQKVLEGLGQIKDSVETLASCATASQAARKNLTVREDEALADLEKLVIEVKDAKFIGVLGDRGSLKPVILKTLFDSPKVHTHFSDSLFLWLTLWQRPSATSVMNELCKQVAIEKKLDLNEAMNEAIKEGEEKWLNRVLQESSRFVLFLDVVWGGSAAELLPAMRILDDLSDQTKSKVIVSSRDRTALLKMGVKDEYTITIEDLMDLRGRMNLIEVQDIVGQEQVLQNLKSMIVDDAQAHKIGVVGESGSGKTLLLKTLFNSQEVRTYFSDGLLLWLTVSENPSMSNLRNTLTTQIEIATHKKADLSKNMKEEEVKIWMNETLQQSSGFVLFLDDVRGGNAAELLPQELGILDAVSNHTKCKVIVSSREPTALSIMGVEDEYIKKIEDLTQDQSWELFKHHAFSYNNGNPPSHLDGVEDRFVIKGVPLGIKAVGRAMASSTHPQQWEWALHRLQNAQNLEDCLRLSYDALGNEDFNMQLCFQHVAAAFSQNEIIDVQEVIPLWMGEGLLAKKMLQYAPPHILADHCLIEPMIRNTEGRPVCLRMQDPFEIGRLYVDLLAERCLIEPIVRDVDGLVVCFRMRNILRDLAIKIAEHEENFFFPRRNESLKGKRIFLSHSELSFLPESTSSSSEMCSLFLSQCTQLTKIPKRLIGSLKSLKVLHLSGTSVPPLPENVGCLKQLVSLKLLGSSKINRLPKSVRDLVHLEILDLSFTNIKELPCDIHMLRSLRYLGLRGCKDLQYLPSSISSLLSLQYLYMDGCSSWSTKPTRVRWKRVASLQNLGDLIQLKTLALESNTEAFSDGILGSMTEIDTLLLILPEMKSLPVDINNLSKLRSLSLKCSKLTKMEPFICSSLTETEKKMKNDVTNLENLRYLKFYECSKLTDFQHLHKLHNLRPLEIIRCPGLEKFPPAFGGKEAFPLLKVFSLVLLENLKELPVLQKDAMLSLQRFNIVKCPKLRIIPEGYSRIKIRVYDCPGIMENLENVERGNMDPLEVDLLEEGKETDYMVNFGGRSIFNL